MTLEFFGLAGDEWEGGGEIYTTTLAVCLPVTLPDIIAHPTVLQIITGLNVSGELKVEFLAELCLSFNALRQIGYSFFFRRKRKRIEGWIRMEGIRR